MKRLKLILLSCLFGLVAHAQVLHYCDSVQADFSSSAPECTESAVSFANSGYSHFNCTYEWDFGAGASPATSTNEFPPAVTYSLAGVKEVSLTVTDVVTGCVSYKNNGVMIYENPTAAFTSSSVEVCENETVDFTNTGSSGTQWNYTWDFGAGAIPAVSSAQNPNGVYWINAGVKTVTLNISNGHCIQSTSLNINVNETPDVSFASNAPACAGSDVDFTNLGASTDCSFHWDFGVSASPVSSTDENPNGVVYASHGAKQVSLTITNTTTSCSATYQDNIIIRETPTVSFTDSGDACMGVDFNFTNAGTSGSAWSYSWDFGTGAVPQISTAENPIGIQYISSGVKTVSLSVNNSYCSNNTTQTIEVFQSPEADFTSNAPVCAGLDVNFLNTGTTSDCTFAWDFGTDASPATSTDESPTGISYATSGNKMITLQVTDNITSCTNQISKTITIKDTPNVSFDYSGDDCVNSEFNFTNTGSTGMGLTFYWDFGDGAIPASSTAENPADVIYASSGIKNVKLTISNGVCSNFINQTITVYQTPVADFVNTSPQCVGLNVDFTNTGTNTDVTYLWNFGTSAVPTTSTDESPMGIIFSDAGTKQVKLTTTNSTTGCLDSITYNINILETPVANFTHSDSLCLGDIYTFNNTGSTGSNLSFTWDFGNGASPSMANSENPAGVLYSTSGMKYVSLTISNASCSNTIIDSVFVLATPIADFSSTAPQCSGLPISFTSTGDNLGVDFLWDFGNNVNPTSSTDQNPQDIVYSQHGIKEVTLTVSNTGTSCSSSTTKTILIHESPIASFSSNAPVCGDEGIDFQNTGSTGSNWAFNWDLGANAQPSSSSSENPSSVLYTQGGLIPVTLYVSDGVCSQSVTNTIEIFQYPDVNAGNDTIICANSSLLLGTPQEIGHIYKWFPTSTLDYDTVPQPIASPNAQVSNYTLIVTDTITGCQSKDTIIVTMLPSAIANAGPDYQICQGDSVQIGAGLVEGQMYFWAYDTIVEFIGVPNPFVSPDESRVYTLNTFYLGCDTITDNVMVTIHQLPNVQATDLQNQDTVEIAQGEYVQLLARGGIQFEWTPEESLDNSWVYSPMAHPDTTTVYTVLATDIYGCSNTDQITVVVNIPGVYIPTAFTPNNDGKNDIFYIRGKGTTVFELNIFNRNGDLIYHSTNPQEGWDGTIQGTGKKLPNGAYVYHTKGEYSDGGVFNTSGMINLIR
ncbi:MAG: PKD domain-containing protein [Bacteroidales bacterium]|nr:PKD domain-containing protein [Bacteroidales bacterium]